MKNILAVISCVSILSLHAEVWEFSLNMTGLTAGTTSVGTGGDLHQNFPTEVPITYDTISHQLRLPIGWGSENGFVDLENTVGSSELPLIRANGLNWYSVSPVNLQTGTSGSADVTIQIVADPRGGGDPYSITAQESDLLQGNWFVSVPSVLYGNGEIRGSLSSVPEPEHYAMLAGLSLLGFGFLRQASRRTA
ncbi:MAG TPA: hypothetical protein VK633_13690 [Verrucomicrobiae bacterium]|nr:hypothetical protein [Verrucomicrobiae bacterium]